MFARAILVLLLVCVNSYHAIAQDAQSIQTIDKLNSVDSSEWLSAANTLQTLNTRALPALMDRLVLVTPLYLTDKSNSSYGPFLADLTNALSTTIANDDKDKNGSIKFIQENRSCEFISDLARLAGNADRSIRLPASSALVNIVDDTTIELAANFILPMLKEGNANGAFNLLQAVKVVSPSALSDTRDKLLPMMAEVDTYLNANPSDAQRTQLLLQDIKAKLQNNRSNKKTADVYRVEPCKPASFTLTPSKTRIAYVHAGSSQYPSESRARIQSIVQSYGVRVAGFDADVDPLRGVGVDFFDDADQPLAQQMATTIGKFIRREQFVARKQSSKLNQPGVFGVWLP
jgi:hypothetical protein